MVQSNHIVLPDLDQALVSNSTCLHGFLSDKLAMPLHEKRGQGELCLTFAVCPLGTTLAQAQRIPH